MEVTFKLDIYEGPLDLLLELISKNKVSINDIPIALILDQYVEYLETLRSLNISFTSDFIVMAAELIYIKSKMLLPAPETETEADPRASLARLLAEYKMFKEVSAVLARRIQLTGELNCKPPEPLPDAPYAYLHSPDMLTRALTDMLSREELRKPPKQELFAGIIKPEGESILEAAESVLRELRARGRQPFRELLARTGNRSAAVVAFIAMLNLCKENKLRLDDNDSVELAEQPESVVTNDI